MKNHITSLELSKKLKEAGIEIESQFVWIDKFPDPVESKLTLVTTKHLTELSTTSYITDVFKEKLKESKIYPAYLATELLEVLPDRINRATLAIEKVGLYEIGYVKNNKLFIPSHEDKYLQNALAKMYLYIKEQGLM